MKNRIVSIVKMDIEKYMSEYGVRYEDGELFDYPLSEMDYILEHTEIEKLALINDRLYEIE